MGWCWDEECAIKTHKRSQTLKWIMHDSDDVMSKNRPNELRMIEIRKSAFPGIERSTNDLCGLIVVLYLD